MILPILCYTDLKKVEVRIHADPDDIEGMKAKYGDRPYQVFVTNSDGFMTCGGVLLEWNYVLTAAHCIKNKYVSGKEYVVKAGIIKKRNDPYEQKQSVTLDSNHIIFNPGWSGKTFREGSADLGNHMYTI